MRISDWSSDVCSSDLAELVETHRKAKLVFYRINQDRIAEVSALFRAFAATIVTSQQHAATGRMPAGGGAAMFAKIMNGRSEEHTSELQSLMRISYAVFCLQKKNYTNIHTSYYTDT